MSDRKIEGSMGGMTQATDVLKKRPRRPSVIAHRGLSWTHPENTMAAFEAAIAAGADMVELDVHRTADGHCVCVHDATLNRYWRPGAPAEIKDRTISQMTLAEVQSLDAGCWKHGRFAGAVFPRLDSVLERFTDQPNAPILLIERKSGNAEQLFNVLDLQASMDRLIVQSFDWDFLVQFRALAPGAVIAMLGEDAISAQTLQTAHRLGASALHWSANSLTSDDIRALHAAGLLAWAYTVNSEMAWRGALQMHVDGITTDRCDAAMNVLCNATASKAVR